MGFDGYLYYVLALDEDGTTNIYEYGNLKHAKEHLEREANAIMIRCKVKADQE